MAYISQQGIYWRAEIRRRGYKPVYRTFDTKQQAQQWARWVKSEMDSGLYFDRSKSERITLTEALGRYQREIAPEKHHPYQDERRSAGRAENTVRLELQTISHLFEIARKECGVWKA
ncbi:hypothetical protein [Paraburkholderia sp. BL25I1N1]|uniref:hypothetical protein n=1 Tax=Paraburkholderia sp. BL25I1N1 TaxID=1938804 RepID=UPI000D04EC1A|nr:hypothetical protein [Paraburkholderia sp. BL25I1N1]PRX98418.1 hypothetical protein B0G73_125114 [Paraburkholderia sp. BL25I1N1]